MYFSLPAEYCFIDFHSQEKAKEAMLKLSGKNIPNSSPVSLTCSKRNKTGDNY